MLCRITCGLVLLGSLATALATAPSTRIEQGLSADQLRDTGLDTLTPAQLDALHRLVNERSDQAVGAIKAERAMRAESSGNDDMRGARLGLDTDPIKSRLKGTVSAWAPGTVFQLENGQTWKVLKGNMTLRKPMAAPEILVVPGIAGRWFLQVDEDLPKARVYRID